MTVEQILRDEAEAATNKYVSHLKRLMRENRPMSVQAAVDSLAEIAGNRSELDAAAALIQAEAERVQNAQEPRAVTAGGHETWYFGPRPEDVDWPTLVRTLNEDGWKEGPLKELDDASNKIVAHLPNPAGQGSYGCRGLVLGYVQSGKTTNFTAVVAKASDAGYRLIIILSGLHEGLRLQTQDRLNEQLWANHPERWRRLTDDQDFLPTYDVDAVLANEQQRTLIVVKKNASRLKALHKWLTEARPEHLERCPILIIDDEADQASVNTAKPDQQPRAINRLIRKLVNDASKCAYVGYTATPFANVLIDPSDSEDLYPSDFIVDLPKPASYLGPETIFGRDPLEHDDTEPDDGHDMIRTIGTDEISRLRPAGTSTRHTFRPEITPSLDVALRYFLLSTAARRRRGAGNPHATALVHTSQHVDIHRATADVIAAHLTGLAHRLADTDTDLLSELQDCWDTECELVTAADFDNTPVSFDDLRPHLATVAAAVQVITDNSRSEERLHFDDADPRIIVAVGGNTLSRGLTLEGLAVSFFVRTASAYDTLLQMGRWFGYRNGYADLTRIWLTDEMRQWFRHLALVEAEIRNEIAAYETDHKTPLEVAVRIRTHPKLTIASAAKMRSARRAEISYSGRRLQTILFNHRDPGWLAANLHAGRTLLETAATRNTRRHPRPGVCVFDHVDIGTVLTFIAGYSFHENSRDLNRDLITRYLDQHQQAGDLTEFAVAVLGRHPATDALGSCDLVPGETTGLINRAPLKNPGGDRTHADIKALMSRDDRAVDLGDQPYAIPADLTKGDIERLRNTPDQGGRGTGSGLLLLYPISPSSRPATTRSARTRQNLDAADVVLGIGIVFPVSPGKALNYYTADLTKLTDVQVESPDDDDLPDPEPQP